MHYKKSDMVYKNYKWTAGADFDDPQFKKYQEHSELNRTEGYEVLWFINYCARQWAWKEDALIASCQKLEKVIHTKVPDPPRTHAAIKTWIEKNYITFWDSI
jgi:hypothetical protein